MFLLMLVLFFTVYLSNLKELSLIQYLILLGFFCFPNPIFLFFFLLCSLALYSGSWKMKL